MKVFGPRPFGVIPAVRMAGSTTVWLDQRASVVEDFVSRVNGSARPFGQRQGIGRMTGKSCLATILADIERGGYPHFVLIQHRTEHAGVAVGKEPIDQLQHRDARAAGEPEDSG